MSSKMDSIEKNNVPKDDLFLLFELTSCQYLLCQTREMASRKHLYMVSLKSTCMQTNYNSYDCTLRKASDKCPSSAEKHYQPIPGHRDEHPTDRRSFTGIIGI